MSGVGKYFKFTEKYCLDSILSCKLKLINNHVGNKKQNN